MKKFYRFNKPEVIDRLSLQNRKIFDLITTEMNQ